MGYASLQTNGYVHKVTVLKRINKSASDLLPRVHLGIYLIKRWLLGTHQGEVHAKHLISILKSSHFASIGTNQEAGTSSFVVWRSKQLQYSQQQRGPSITESNGYEPGGFPEVL